MSPEGMAAAARQFDAVLQQVTANLDKAASTAEKAVHGSAQAGQSAVAQINGQLKALQVTLGQIETMKAALRTSSGGGGIRAAGVLGDFGDVQNLGRQARALGEFRSSMTATSSAAQALRGRITDLTDRYGRLTQAGVRLSSVQVNQAQKLDNTAKAYSKVSNEANNLRGRIALLSDEGQQAFRPMLRELDEVEKANARAFRDRRRFNYDDQINATRRVVRNLRENLVVRERLEQKTRLNIQALREEGVQIVRNTALEREAALARSVRAAQTRFRNVELIGGSIRQRDTDQLNRFARASALAATNQNQLTAALNSPNTSARRLQTLINRHNILQRELGETIALQNQANSGGGGGATPNRGGFFAGLRQGRLNAFSGADGDGAFGAGALVARVGAYAVAASAVYGVISAIQQATSFAIQFEDALAQLQAISGSTTTEMNRLAASILEVSRNSTNSVMELTRSATIIAQAGFGGNEIGTILENVVNLAGASGSSTDEAVDILTSSLGAYQLAAEESTRVTDGLVAVLNESKLGIEQVRLGIQYLGATARVNNISIEETMALMATAADAGIRSGSTAGTGTRRLLIDLLDPSEKLLGQLQRIGLTTADIDVRTLGLIEVLTRLRDAGFQSYGTLQTRAAAMYEVYVRNIDAIQDNIAVQNQQGLAQEAMTERLDSTSAAWQRMLNTLSSLMATIGEGLSPVFQRLIRIVEVFAAVILAPIAAVAELVGLLFSLGDATASTATTVESFQESLEDAGFSTDEARRRAEEMSGSLGDMETALRDTQAEIATLETSQRSLRSETQLLITRAIDYAGANGDLSETTAQVSAQVNNLAARFPGLREEFAKTQGGIAGLIQAMMALDLQAQRTLATMARVQLGQAQENRRNALREAGQAVHRYTPRRFGLVRLPIQVGHDPQRQQLARRFTRLLGTNRMSNITEAHRLATLRGNEWLQTAFPNTFRDISSAIRNYTDARTLERESRQQIEVAEFLSSRDGQRITRAMTRDSGNAQRASSQGTDSEGRTTAQLRQHFDRRMAQYEALAEQYEDNPYAHGVIGSAITSLNANINSLDGGGSGSDSDSDSGGGGRGGRSRRSEAERLARRRQRDFQRNESTIKREELAFRRQLFENSVEALENAPSLDELPTMLEQVDSNLQDFLNNQKELALENILRSNPTPAQRTRLIENAARTAEEARIENINSVAQTLNRAIQEYLDRTTEAIEDQYEEATRFAQRNSDLAKARVEGLSRTIGTEGVSDSFRTVVQRDAELAEDRLRRAQIPSNERRIAQLEALRNEAQEIKDDLEFRLEYLGNLQEQAEASGNVEQEIVVTAQMLEVTDRLRDSQERIDDLADSTRDLRDANENLRESYAVLNDVPRTFAEGVRVAFEAIRIEANYAGSFGQEIIKNLRQPIDAARGAFSDFFRDVVTGSESIGQAFENMASRIIDAIIEIAIQALANQFFSIIGSAFGGIGGGGSVGSFGGGLGGPAPFSVPFIWGGGEVPGFIGGGQIQTGLETRDSTLIKAAKKEYVIRRPSAESIGKPMLDAMNQYGAQALKGIAPTVIANDNPTPVETNVYVISEKEKPQLGPNDVVAIITKDALAGGQTKKLIKKVANGG